MRGLWVNKDDPRIVINKLCLSKLQLKKNTQKNIHNDPNFYLKNLSHIWSCSSFPRPLPSCSFSVF